VVHIKTLLRYGADRDHPTGFLLHATMEALRFGTWVQWGTVFSPSRVFPKTHGLVANASLVYDT